MLLLLLNHLITILLLIIILLLAISVLLIRVTTVLAVVILLLLLVILPFSLIGSVIVVVLIVGLLLLIVLIIIKIALIILLVMAICVALFIECFWVGIVDILHQFLIVLEIVLLAFLWSQCCVFISICSKKLIKLFVGVRSLQGRLLLHLGFALNWAAHRYGLVSTLIQCDGLIGTVRKFDRLIVHCH